MTTQPSSDFTNEPIWVSKGRIPTLDGLRAVAIIFVMVAHAVKTEPFSEAVGRTLGFFRFGSLGVDIFFVFSGFLITTLLLRESKNTGRISLGKFYARRVIRIIPAYCFYIAFVAIATLIRDESIPQADWISAGSFTMNFRDKPTWALGHLWSLSIEEHFYLIWPITIALLSRKLAVTVLIFSLVSQPIIRWGVLFAAPEYSAMTDLWTFTRSDSIDAGSLMAIMATE